MRRASGPIGTALSRSAISKEDADRLGASHARQLAWLHTESHQPCKSTLVVLVALSPGTCLTSFNIRIAAWASGGGIRVWCPGPAPVAGRHVRIEARGRAVAPSVQPSRSLRLSPEGVAPSNMDPGAGPAALLLSGVGSVGAAFGRGQPVCSDRQQSRQRSEQIPTTRSRRHPLSPAERPVVRHRVRRPIRQLSGFGPGSAAFGPVRHPRSALAMATPRLDRDRRSGLLSSFWTPRPSSATMTGPLDHSKD